jgi:dihydropteroate synthase
VKDSSFYACQSIRIKGKLLVFNKPLTMGIINITHDSFYKGSRTQGVESVLAKAGSMLAQGADILDLGAASTRPGADEVSIEDELNALIPAIAAVAGKYPDAVISADTYRASVANEAIRAGAHMINDIGSGNLDPAMWPTVAALRVPYILMHNRGTPQTMNSLAQYSDVVNEVVLELSQKLLQLRQMGVADVIVDPGFGFAKTVAHNFELLRRFDELKLLGAPLLAGLSRKSMIWRTLQTTPEDALNGSTALHMAALERGAHILRVHDVKEAVECVKLFRTLKGMGTT